MKRYRQGARLAGCLVVALIWGVPEADAADATGRAEFDLVAEMETLDGIVAQPRRVREALKDRADARPGLARLEAWTRAQWPRIREVDLEALSRHHVELTRGFELPAEPGELTGRPIAHDETSGLWYLELRGPRLPARYDIVHRYLHVYASFDPATGRLDKQTITIRGWVLE